MEENEYRLFNGRGTAVISSAVCAGGERMMPGRIFGDKRQWYEIRPVGFIEEDIEDWLRRDAELAHEEKQSAQSAAVRTREAKTSRRERSREQRIR